MTEKVEVSWEGEIYRDTATYCFIELASTVLETAFEQDANLSAAYEKRLAENPEGAEESAPLPLYAFSPEQDAEIQLFAMPAPNEFFVRFKTDVFEISVSMAYDFTRMSIDAARIVMFSGNVVYALTWARALRETLDDMLVDYLKKETCE